MSHAPYGACGERGILDTFERGLLPVDPSAGWSPRSGLFHVRTGVSRSMAEAPKSQIFTVIVVSDHSQAVRKFRVPRRLLQKAVWGGLGFTAVALFVGIHYLTLLSAASENAVLREEKEQLRSQVLLVQEKVAHIGATLDRVERFDAKLRTAVSSLQDPVRNLAIGPVGTPEPETVPAGPVPAAEQNLKALPGRLGSMEADAARSERSLRQLQEYFDDQRSLLASTPSIWPTRGWVTSDFGTRVDPYSEDRKMHEGLDVATPHGQQVSSPSDGVVVFNGVEGGYGKVLVIDHGYGVKTRYGHLSETFVRVGDRVKRGDKVAGVGNTGKSTGPHLHYEVRVNGIPENPRKFILE
jgi:murein DD-endopeptidase MepM/ murein hydrolase activator NlpD